MKKITKILSVALVAMMVLSLSAAALAETPSVYIPQRLAKLAGNIWLEDYLVPTFAVKVSDLAVMKDKNGNKIESKYCKDPANDNGMAYVKSITEDSVMQFQWDIAPDWFGCSVSSLDYAGGWANIDIDESGYGELEVGELHRQPGTWYAQSKGWAGAGGDNIFSAGKDFGDYSVEASYYRNGSVYKVAITPKEAEDVFRTGQEGAVVTYTFEKVNVRTQCLEDDYYASKDYEAYKMAAEVYKNEKKEYDDAKAAFDKQHEAWVKDKEAWEKGGCIGDAPVEPKFEQKAPAKPAKPAMGNGVDVWYMSQVKATYPAGNYIAAVEVNYRNDKKQNAYDYKISYAVSDNEIYKITYAPTTSTVLEKRDNVNELGEKYTTFIPLTGSNAYKASNAEKDKDGKLTGNYYIHHSADEAIYGEYYRNGNKVAVSGSGNKLNKWYAPGHGKQVKNVKKGISSFKSPRVF